MEVEAEKENEETDENIPTEEVVPQFRDPPVYVEPKKGDNVEYYEKETDSWKEAVIIAVLKRWKEWYNIKHIDGSQCSVNLGKETLWRFKEIERNEYYKWRWRHAEVNVVDDEREEKRGDVGPDLFVQ